MFWEEYALIFFLPIACLAVNWAYLKCFLWCMCTTEFHVWVFGDNFIWKYFSCVACNSVRHIKSVSVPHIFSKYYSIVLLYFFAQLSFFSDTLSTPPASHSDGIICPSGLLSWQVFQWFFFPKSIYSSASSCPGAHFCLLLAVQNSCFASLPASFKLSFLPSASLSISISSFCMWAEHH